MLSKLNKMAKLLLSLFIVFTFLFPHVEGQNEESGTINVRLSFRELI